MIIEMTMEYAEAISLWKYDGIYSFYDQDENDAVGFMDGTHFVYIKDGELIGYFCFGAEARIPTVEENVYDNEFLDIGLGLRPDLCGKGYGLSFFQSGLDHADTLHNTRNFRLSVAAFNERAIKLYEKAGFIIDREVTNSYFNNKFFIMHKKGD